MQEISDALKKFKQMGYKRVSLSEVAHDTKIQRDTIMSVLCKDKTIVVDMVMGEVYVFFESRVPVIQSCRLPKLKHTFEVERGSGLKAVGLDKTDRARRF
jgi:hypothetical protein